MALDADHISSAITALQGSGGWDDELSSMADVIVRELAVPGLCIYFLRLRSGALEPVHLSGKLDLVEALSLTPTARPLADNPATASLWGACQTKRPVRSHDYVSVPIYRGRVPILAVSLRDPSQTIYTDQHGIALQRLFSAMRPLYLERRLTKLMFHMRQPLDYSAGQDQFLDALGELILAASGMRYAALRTYDEGKGVLHCVRTWGFNEPPRYDLLHWPLDRYEPFYLAFTENELQAVESIEQDHPELDQINTVPGLDDVESFVVAPVTISGEPYGVLSMATTCPYSYLEAEKSAYESLTNAAGIAFSHYRQTHGMILTSGDTEQSTMSTALEIASSARHEAKDIIDGLIGDIGRQRARKTAPALDELESDLLLLASIIDKIRLASKPPSYDISVRGLDEIWEEAVSQVSGRLDVLHVRQRRDSATNRFPKVRTYHEWFRLCFIHLLLNSIDAFEGKGFGTRQPRNQGRQIALHVEKFSRSDASLRIRYSDNATGINPDKVVVPDKYASLSFEQAIFMPGVSSKYDNEGEPLSSGHGLHLIRRALAEHGGGIQLVEWRGGVTFELTIPASRVIL